MSPTSHDHVPSTTEEVRQCYNEHASAYAFLEPAAEYLGLRRLRRRLIRRASGDVLEIAVGTGANLRYYPRDCRITAVDVSASMLEIACERANKRELQVDFHVMDAEHLGFPDEHFDTVVSTMALCTFIDPIAALKEMGRVCRPGGRILLLEHGRSSWGRLARWQDRQAQRHAERFACHWNREPLELVQDAGLLPLYARRSFFGMLHEIVALPSGAQLTA